MKLISITWSNNDLSSYQDSFLYRSFIKYNDKELFLNFHFNTNNDYDILKQYYDRFRYQYEYIYYKIVVLNNILKSLTYDIYIVADTTDVICLGSLNEIAIPNNSVLFSSELHQYPNLNEWNRYQTPDAKFLNSGIFASNRDTLMFLLNYCIKSILPLNYHNFGGDQGVYTYAYLNSNLITLDDQYFLSTYCRKTSDYFLLDNRVIDRDNNKPLFIHDNGWNYGSPKFIEHFNLI